jgi:hypothetical protein
LNAASRPKSGAITFAMPMTSIATQIQSSACVAGDVAARRRSWRTKTSIAQNVEAK